MQFYRKLVLFGLLTPFLIVSGLAQESFEGVINMSMVNKRNNIDEKSKIKWFVKGQQHRFDYETKTSQYGGQFSIVVNSQGTFMVADSGEKAGKRVIQIPQKQLDKPQFQIRNFTAKGEAESASLHDRECQKHHLMINDSLDVTLWVSTDFPLSPSQLPKYMQSSFWKIAQKVGEEGKSFPLQIEVRNPEGKLVFAQYFKKVKNQEVSPDLFKVN